jgi:5'-nucleotidase
LYLIKFQKKGYITEYSCSTPVDCVKIGKQNTKRKPDLYGIRRNHHLKSINVDYSGTMSAAVEAGIEGTPAIGFH